MNASSPSPWPLPSALTPAACARALAARDARFDGLFYVGITSTGIYCRPVCPARVSHTDRRRFFPSAAAAEQAGYRPCLRCRPELAPGRAPVDAISRLGTAAARRIEGGALNSRTVTELATELGVSARHLRRALEREFGVSPSELAQTCRLLLAKRLLADTALPVTRIAFASGFQSLRRFNAAFLEQYRMPPSALRRARRAATSRVTSGAPGSLDDALRLTLAYRNPFDWDGLLTLLARDSIPGVEIINGKRYLRTIRLAGHAGAIMVGDGAGHLNVDIAPSLVPVLMPLLPGLRRLFDLDAEPLVIDDHLARTGLGPLVRKRPGVRLPGATDPFEVILGMLLRDDADPGTAEVVLRRLVEVLGDAIDTGIAGLDRLAPGAERITDAGVSGLTGLGVPAAVAAVLTTIARRIAEGTVRLQVGGDSTAAHGALMDAGVREPTATRIVMRALYWPDVFPTTGYDLLRGSDAWRPWRAYGAIHLWLDAIERRGASAPARRTVRPEDDVKHHSPRRTAIL